ncbi:YceI family protein [Paracidobacterium acidisoli]|nr:YceI family protein [Paracidobacterium acidisoli]MBT9332809.1 YceI family protein [Paracidobacterium acidisoli]
MCALALLACFVPAAVAQSTSQVTVHLDPSQTQIHWTLQGNMHTVHGTFQLKGGLITFDPASGVAEGEVLVDAASGQSGEGARDRRMQSDVLESPRYPQIIFHPQKVSGTVKPGDAQNVTVDGTFTLHGKDHPLTLALKVEADAGGHVTASTHFVIPYVAWGMKNPSNFLFRVDKEVAIDVEAKGTVEGLKP